MSLKKNLFWLSVFFIISWMWIQYRPVTVRIYGAIQEKDFSIQMPLRDKERLEWFFRDVCFLNASAYTLMGSKPMSIHQYTKPWPPLEYFFRRTKLKHILLDCFWPPCFQNIRLYCNPEQLKLKLGWETLNKYIHYFPNSRFVLYSSDPLNNEIIGLTLIDKKIIQVVKKNIEDFKAVLELLRVEPDELFDDMKLRRFLKELTHDGFLGTLLGFGRDNAWLYYRYGEMNLEKSPMVSAWPSEELENSQKLNQKSMSLEPWDLTDLFYPRFACDPESEETELLRQVYRREREEIMKYYKNKDIVEATLSLFAR